MTGDDRPAVEALILWRGPCGRVRLEWHDDRPLRDVAGLGPIRLRWYERGRRAERTHDDLVDLYGQDANGLCRGRTRRAP